MAPAAIAPERRRQISRSSAAEPDVDVRGPITTTPPHTRRVKVAIVGSGLAGLHAAHRLSRTAALRDKYEVHIFERNEALGLDASSINVQADGHVAIKQGQTTKANGHADRPMRRVDVPMRSVNAGYYPNLLNVYRRLGIQLRSSNFTFSFASFRLPQRPFLLYNGQNGLRGFSMPTQSMRRGWSNVVLPLRQGYLALVIVWSYLCLITMALYHHICGHLLDPHHPLNHQSIGSWTAQHQRTLHPHFVHSILYTLFSAVTTSSIDAVERIPAAEVLLYVAATFLRNHHAVEGGVQTVEGALISTLDPNNVHLSCSVAAIEWQGSTKGTASIRINCHGANDEEPQHVVLPGFDHVVLATPATLSASLVKTYIESVQANHAETDHNAVVERLEAMRSALQCVRYEDSAVVNHRDLSLLPADRRHWRDLNLVVCPSSSKLDAEEADAVMATHIIQTNAETGYMGPASMLVLQTTNPGRWPAADTILSTSRFVRALTPRSKRDIEALFRWHSVRLTAWQRLLLLQRVVLTSYPWYSGQSHPADDTLQADWISQWSAIMTGRQWQLRLGASQQANFVAEHQADHPSIWACGSYAQGIPLLEGCITGSTLVTEEILHQGARMTVH